LKLVSDARSIFVSEEELRAAQKSIRYVQHMWEGVNILNMKQEIHYENYSGGYLSIG
jgi:hypothetical protein